MWGDKLMNITTPEGQRYGGVERERVDPVTGKRWFQPETWQAAAHVPKDILVVDWYWSLDPESERNFHKLGFDVFYGNFHPIGFKDWSTAPACRMSAAPRCLPGARCLPTPSGTMASRTASSPGST